MGVVRSAENVVQRYVKVVGVFQKNLGGGCGIVDLISGESGLGNVEFLKVTLFLIEGAFIKCY